MKAVDSASNLIRAVVSLVIVGILGFASWVGYSMFQDAQQGEKAIKELEQARQDLDAMRKDLDETKSQLQLTAKQLEETRTALRLLKVDRRVALITIDDQSTTEDGRTMTQLTFKEMDRDGKVLGQPKHFTLESDVVHVSTLVAKFDDELVESGDPLRGTSLCLLQSIYGDNQAPADGFRLDEEGTRPVAYDDGTQVSAFEQDIWDNFWDYANDPTKAKQIGLRAASGEAPFIRVRKGMTYRLELRASGGLTFLPEPQAFDTQAQQDD